MGLLLTNSHSQITSQVQPTRTAAVHQAPTTTTIATAGSTSTVPNPTTTTTTTGALAGKVIAIDPGHNGGNFSDPSFIDSQIWNGRTSESCDTTGTETDSGYTEALFNFNVAEYLATDLEAEGARVVLTRSSNSGVGPCVDQRAAIGNAVDANAAISIHADGGPSTGRGFAILEPVADGPNNSVITSSALLGADIRSAFISQNVEQVSTYDGVDGIQSRDDLAGLNLTTVPKVLVECANMRNSADAAPIVTTAWQEDVAKSLASALTEFVATGH